MREIKLGNRYRVKNKLVEVEENLFKLVLEDEREGDFLGFSVRDGYSYEDNEHYSIDPSGGPYMCLDMTFSELPGMKISRIYSEKDENDRYTHYIKFDKI